MSRDDLTRVVGYFAYRRPGEVFRHDAACVVGGTEDGLRRYVGSAPDRVQGEISVSKIRLGEIIEGLGSGAAYAFDDDAYARFFPMARRHGLDVREPGPPPGPADR